MIKYRGNRKLICILVISVALTVFLIELEQILSVPSLGTSQKPRKLGVHLHYQGHHNSPSLAPQAFPPLAQPTPGGYLLQKPDVPADASSQMKYLPDQQGRGKPAVKGLQGPEQRPFTFRALDFDGRTTTAGRPNLRAQGAIGQMVIEMRRRQGLWTDVPPGLQTDGGPQHRDQDHRMRRPSEVSQRLKKEADRLWGLIQMETKQPVLKVQSGNGSNCSSINHVFFAKVHKTGSSTVANILQRYGFARGLNFVLPRKRIHSRSYNYISMLGQPVSRAKLIPHPPGQTYDIMWNHAIYDSEFYHALMPADTVFVSILRHPLQQFQSAFEYYGSIPGSQLYSTLQANVSNPLSLYLQHPTSFEWPGTYTSYLRNKQSQDMGMNNQHVLNATLRHQYIHKLDKDFHFVIITELFDESLVLLRRLLCWELKDIVYILKNKNPKKKKRTFSEKDRAAHRRLNEADFELYEHFLQRLSATLTRQPTEFGQEVTHFKEVLKKVQEHCSKPGPKQPLSITTSQWSSAFLITNNDCKVMQRHELFFLDDLMVNAVRKYQRSVTGS